MIMGLKQKAILILRECDFINEEIQKLRKKEQSKRQEISNIKKMIESEYSYLIGKKAICSNDNDPMLKNIECVCSAVMCTDSFDIAPLFTHKGKKCSVDVFDWL